MARWPVVGRLIVPGLMEGDAHFARIQELNEPLGGDHPVAKVGFVVFPGDFFGAAFGIQRFGADQRAFSIADLHGSLGDVAIGNGGGVLRPIDIGVDGVGAPTLQWVFCLVHLFIVVL
jgi:hypothetical protein